MALLSIIFVVASTVAPFAVCYLGTRMERDGGRLGRVPYLIRLIVPWAPVMAASYYAVGYMIALGGSSGTMLLAAGMTVIQCIVYGYTGLLMARRLNDMGVANRRWLAALAGFPVVGLLIPLIIGFLPPDSVAAKESV